MLRTGVYDYGCKTTDDDTYNVDSLERKSSTSNSSSGEDIVRIKSDMGDSGRSPSPHNLVLEEAVDVERLRPVKKQRFKITKFAEKPDDDDDGNELYRVPLNSNKDQSVHVVVKTFMDKPYIHIRKHFKTLNRRGKVKWQPTKQGVTLKPEDFNVLLKNLACIIHAANTAPRIDVLINPPHHQNSLTSL